MIRVARTLTIHDKRRLIEIPRIDRGGKSRFILHAEPHR
nr:MAG TPA: hypothetical protein [Caudoviricetes sp.]